MAEACGNIRWRYQKARPNELAYYINESVVDINGDQPLFDATKYSMRVALLCAILTSGILTHCSMAGGEIYLPAADLVKLKAFAGGPMPEGVLTALSESKRYCPLR